jgi:hypothetical protein
LPQAKKAQPRSVAEYLEGKPPEMAKLFRRFEGMVAACGESRSAVSRTVVCWKRKRNFCCAFILSSKRLELSIDLRRTVAHPRLMAAFHTTQTVVTHRLRVENEAQLDDSIARLVCEAYETVGPGTP